MLFISHQVVLMSSCQCKMGLEQLKLLSELTEELVARKEQFKISCSNVDGFSFEFQNIYLGSDEPGVPSKNEENSCKICDFPPQNLIKDPYFPCSENMPICVKEPASPLKHFVGRTLVEVEAECKNEDICEKLTKIFLNIIGRGTYSF